MPSSTSPMSRMRARSPTWPSKTTDTLLMPVPPSGGVAGTWPRIGHRTRKSISSTDEPVAGGESQSNGRTRSSQVAQPRGVARPGPAHPGLEHPRDVVPLEQEREPGDVVLVRVAQHDGVDPPVPRRDPPVEVDEQAVRVRPTVDEQATAARAFDEDRVALPDIEDRDRRRSRPVVPRRPRRRRRG